MWISSLPDSQAFKQSDLNVSVPNIRYETDV